MTNLAKFPKIPNHFSVYLDLARFLAALFVLLDHFKSLGPQSIMLLIPSRGHDFVIVFFVLSGYVITYAADQKRHLGLSEFVIDRATRIFSVSIPALLFSLLLSFYYSALPNEIPNLLINLVFLGQIGFKQFLPFWNFPYWSLCYEVMYYVGFAIVFFLENSKKKYILLLLFLIIAGPKVLLLMPCWLMGCFAYLIRDKFVFKPKSALFLGLFIPAIIGVLLYLLRYADVVQSLVPKFFGSYHNQLGFSEYFLVDYVKALVVTVHLYLMRFVNITWPSLFIKWIRAGASMSFTLYLMHVPLVTLIGINLNPQYKTLEIFVFLVICVIFLCALISKYTEEKRYVFKSALKSWLANWSKN